MNSFLATNFQSPRAKGSTNYMMENCCEWNGERKSEKEVMRQNREGLKGGGAVESMFISKLKQRCYCGCG
jgi:hypothetical protein